MLFRSVIGSVFFVYLLRLNKPDELMTKSLGFFGALWGVRAVLVPGTVKVFPTLIDYVVLIIFSFVFGLIVVRVHAPNRKGGNEHES